MDRKFLENVGIFCSSRNLMYLEGDFYFLLFNLCFSKEIWNICYILKFLNLYFTCHHHLRQKGKKVCKPTCICRVFIIFEHWDSCNT